MSVIDDFLLHVPDKQKQELERIRVIGKKVVPSAREVISYGMPALTYKGKAFLGFNAHKNHIGIYPYGGEEISEFKDKLTDFGLSKGAIRVSDGKQMPEDLLTQIILHRIKRIDMDLQKGFSSLALIIILLGASVLLFGIGFMIPSPVTPSLVSRPTLNAATQTKLASSSAQASPSATSPSSTSSAGKFIENVQDLAPNLAASQKTTLVIQQSDSSYLKVLLPTASVTAYLKGLPKGSKLISKTP